jgi:hypothetical protein
VPRHAEVEPGKKEDQVSQLVVIAYPDEVTAQQALGALKQLNPTPYGLPNARQ